MLSKWMAAARREHYLRNCGSGDDDAVLKKVLTDMAVFRKALEQSHTRWASASYKEIHLPRDEAKRKSAALTKEAAGVYELYAEQRRMDVPLYLQRCKAVDEAEEHRMQLGVARPPPDPVVYDDPPRAKAKASAKTKPGKKGGAAKEEEAVDTDAEADDVIENGASTDTKKSKPKSPDDDVRVIEIKMPAHADREHYHDKIDDDDDHDSEDYDGSDAPEIFSEDEPSDDDDEEEFVVLKSQQKQSSPAPAPFLLPPTNKKLCGAQAAASVVSIRPSASAVPPPQVVKHGKPPQQAHERVVNISM